MERRSLSNSQMMSAIRNDSELMEEIHDTLTSESGSSSLESLGVRAHTASEMLESLSSGRESPVDDDRMSTLEAIVMRKGRPSFLVQNDRVVIPSQEEVWRSRLISGINAVESTLSSIGRVEVSGNPNFDWLGTAWLAAPDIVVTNRHVALEFAQAAGSGFVFRPGVGNRAMSANIDFKEEYQGTSEDSVEIESILYISNVGAAYPDLALLKLKSGVARRPLRLASNSTPKGEYVGIVGYPARDDRRNDPAAARDIFRDIYEKKRFAPGQVQQGPSTNQVVFEHNCSTLGGNSGSAVLDAKTGEVLGLHFGGKFESANYAVRTEIIHQYLTRATTSGRSGMVVERPASVDDYSDRQGYDPQFLGDGEDLVVPLPDLIGKHLRDVQRQTAGLNKNSPELKYCHFSVVMSKSRRLPFFTAVNIDGNSLKRPRRRKDVWKLDPRIPAASQAGNDLYANNKLDRGHQVRRLDPVWGDDKEASLAEMDTFHFTNSCPQHARLNQGKELWAGLEDYILDNTDERNLRVCVFTGPVFGDRDLDYRGFKIPQDYWKVAVNVRSDGKLSATGYILSQHDFMDDLEFAFGQYRTFQVPLKKIEETAGIVFPYLYDHDPLASIEGVSAAIPLDGYESIMLL